MKRFTAHLIFPSAGVELLRSVVELDESGMITGVISLDNTSVEPAHTLFLDGIITPGIVSIREFAEKGKKTPDLTNYHYLDLSDGEALPEVINTDLPLIIDFGTSNLSQANKIIEKFASSGFSIRQLVDACIFHPAEALGICVDVNVGNKTFLIRWQNVDVLSRKTTPLTRLEEL